MMSHGLVRRSKAPACAPSDAGNKTIPTHFLQTIFGAWKVYFSGPQHVDLSAYVHNSLPKFVIIKICLAKRKVMIDITNKY